MRVKHESAEEQFGSRVRSARESKGWSQENLVRRLREAAGIDMHQTAMARLERGERAIRFNEATALARVLGIDLRPFTGRAEEPLLTDEDYDRVKKLAAERREAEEVLTKQILALREKHVSEVGDLEATRAHYAETRWKLDMALAEYEENRSRGKH